MLLNASNTSLSGLMVAANSTKLIIVKIYSNLGKLRKRLALGKSLTFVVHLGNGWFSHLNVHLQDFIDF